jgi:hypothetical protein
MVEIEIGVLASQFLDRRIAHPPLLEIDRGSTAQKRCVR